MGIDRVSGICYRETCNWTSWRTSWDLLGDLLGPPGDPGRGPKWVARRSDPLTHPAGDPSCGCSDPILWMLGPYAVVVFLTPWEVPNGVKYGGKTPKTRILRCLAVGHLNGNQWGSCSCRYPPTGDYTPFGWILTPYGARPWNGQIGTYSGGGDPWDLVPAGLSTPGFFTCH